MIKEIHLHNFKIHKKTELILGNLTLLAGLNSMGKSSIIQAFLLLRQSYMNNDKFQNGLVLNGHLTELGTASDVFYMGMLKKETLDFFLKVSNRKSVLKWQAKDIDTKDKTDIKLFSKFQIIKDLSLFTDNFQYISSQRIAPTEIHLKNSLLAETKKQVSFKKGQGELAVHFLSYYRNEKIPVEMHHPKEKSPHLIDQVNAWMNEISPNVNIVIQENSFTNIFILHFRYYQEAQSTYTPEFTPENIGFGVSHVLPIVVAILSAPKDSLILIENPEAHIHPNGQAKLVELMCLAAEYGVQIIVETHSDHIINGTLVQCKRFRTEQHGINRKNVKIYYFDRAEEEYAANVKEIEILEDERITNPPAGFFDQIRKDYKFLVGF